MGQMRTLLRKQRDYFESYARDLQTRTSVRVQREAAQKIKSAIVQQPKAARARAGARGR